MTERITISGLVATTPVLKSTDGGHQFCTFRLAANSRYFDRDQGAWVTSNTNWFTVNTFRQFALNVAESLNKGNRILVSGKLKVRNWDNGERSGTSVEIEADSLGIDLVFGTASFSRTLPEVDTEPLEDDLEEELDKELVPA
jgi:single-strand DNA-binding protein